MAEYVEGVGQLGDPVKPVPGVDWTKLALSAQEGFVLSRIDGFTSASLLCEMTGLGRQLTIEILKTLRAKGVIVVGNETPRAAPPPPAIPVPPAPPVITPPARTGRRRNTPVAEVPPAAAPAAPLDPWLEAEFEQEEREGVDLKREVRSMLRHLHTRLDDMTFFELLGIPLDADLRQVRRAYFEASKLYHPDRYFTKNCGQYGDMLGRVFKQVNAAYEFLQDDAKREQYRRMIRQERENENITRDLERQVAQVADALAGEPAGGVDAAQVEFDQPEKTEPKITPSEAAEGTRRRPPMAPSSAPSAPSAPQAAGLESGRPTDALNEDERPSGGEGMSPEVEEARPRSATVEGSTYSVVRPPRKDRVRAPRPPAPARTGVQPSVRETDTDEVELSPEDRSPEDSAAVRERPTTGGSDEADDEERAERRRLDRLRRSRMTASNPVLQRKRKALTFYEQGLKQLQEGKSLAAAASLKLAMTYDTTEDKYRQLYEEAVDASRSTTAEGFFKRAIFEESVGRHETAGKLYQRAADIFPKGAYLQRAAESLMWVDDLAKAKEYATQAVQIEPNSVEARLTLAQVYLSSGLKKNARREVDMALKIDSGNADAKELLKKIKRA